MAIDVKMYLHDIAVSIQAIEQHISNVKSVEEFENNLLITDAIERRLSIIGEALNTANKQNPNIKITICFALVQPALHSWFSVYR